MTRRGTGPQMRPSQPVSGRLGGGIGCHGITVLRTKELSGTPPQGVPPFRATVWAYMIVVSLHPRSAHPLQRVLVRSHGSTAPDGACRGRDWLIRKKPKKQ